MTACDDRFLQIHNPFDADLVIEFVQADGIVNGEMYAHFDQGFTDFVIPPGQTVNSGKFGHVKLVKGALASLGIIPLGYLDVNTVDTIRFVAQFILVILLAYLLNLCRIGINGYRVPWMHVNQEHVATTYDLGLLSLGDLMSAAQSILSPLTSGVGLVTSELGGLVTIKATSLPTGLPTTVPSALVSEYYLYNGQADLFIMLARPAYWQPNFANSMSSILKRTAEFIDQLHITLSFLVVLQIVLVATLTW